MIVNVKDSTTLKRDMRGNQIINTDSSSLNAYLAMRDQKQREADRLNKLESELSDIKSMLMTLIQQQKS